METLEKPGTRICGSCGEAGHNARTCGRPATSKPESTGTRTCGNCGEKGHNARTCGNPKAAESVADQRSARVVADPKPEGQGRTCGICGNTGHNARTCKTSPLEKAEVARAAGEGKKKTTSSFTVTPSASSATGYEAPKPFVMQPAKALDSIKGTEDFCPNTEDGKHIMKKEWCEACSRYNPSQASIDAYKANVAASKNKNKNDA